MSQFIEMFGGMTTTPVKDYIDDSFPGEWGTEDKDGNGVKVIRTTNFTNSGKLNLEDVVTRNIEERKVLRKQIKKYDTILERSGGTVDNPVGRVVLFEEDEQYLCNNFTQVLRFKNIDPRFAFYSLYYFYQTNKTAIRSMGSKTTGIQNLNMGKYQEIGIPNASDEQQKAFVSIAEQADKSEFVGFKSQFIEMFDFEDLTLSNPSNSFSKKCYDDTSSATKVAAADYQKSGRYAIYDQSQDCNIAGFTDSEEGLCYNYPAVLFGDHSRVVKYINQPFYIGADGVKIIHPKEEDLLPEFLYYDLLYHNIPNTGYNRHFKYVKMLRLTEATIDKQKQFLQIAHQADKSEFELRKSIEAIDQVIKSLING